MSRKSHRLSKQLEIAGVGIDDPQLIIRNELKGYLARKQALKQKVYKYVLRGCTGLILVLLAYFYLPGIVRSIIFTFNYMATHRIVDDIQENAMVINFATLDQLPLDSFLGYEFYGEQQLTNTAKYAALIHHYNNDFYGKVNNLSEQYEQRLLAYIAMNEFNQQDLCGLHTSLIDDTSRTLEEFILDKIYNEEPGNGYFNPIFDELKQLINLYQSQYDNALRRSYAKPVIKNIREMIVTEELSIGDEDLILDAAIKYCVENPTAIDEVLYYRRKIAELRQEYDIRMGLLYLAIGRDYKVRGDGQNFGWLKAGYKGKTFIKDRNAPAMYKDYYQTLIKELDEYNSFVNESRMTFSQIKLEDWHLHIENPLRIGLKVKDVGLFGARRKSQGEYYEHSGIDLIAEEGTPVYPVQDGFITNVEVTTNGGHVVEIWHDSNISSVYAHLSNSETWCEMKKRFDNEGPFWVSRNDEIANVGMTGNIPEDSDQYGYAHLHLEIKKYNRYKNPFLLFNEQIIVLHD